jgi:hypothetical protein
VSSKSPKRRFNFRCLLAVLLAMQCLLWVGSTLGPAIAGVGFDEAATKRAVLQDATGESALREITEFGDDDATLTDRERADVAITGYASLDGARDIAGPAFRTHARGPPTRA